MSRQRARSWTGRAFVVTSLDGYTSRHDHDSAWLTAPPADGHAKPARSPVVPSYEAYLGGVDSVVMGRLTYETVRRARPWPYPNHRVLVLSHTLHPSDDRITVTRSTVETVRLLNEARSLGVAVEGNPVLQDWLQRGLVDDLVLARAPVLIGGGIPFVGGLEGADIQLTHVGTEWTAAGYVTSRYRVLAPQSRPPERRR